MCGIFGYLGEKDNASQIVLTGLKELEYRGYDSWGIAAVSDKNNQIVVKKTVGKIGSATVSDFPKSHIAIGHTRWATHGGVTQINAHPHLDCSGRFALIHNGIAENYEDILKSLPKKHRIKSQTDTEVLVHLIEEFSKKHNTQESIRMLFNKITGLNAIVVLDSLEGKIFAAKNGSPLVIAVSGPDVYLASDSASLLSVSKNLLFLADEEMAVISNGKVLLQNVHNGESIPVHLEKVDWETSASVLGKYNHYMLKEIEEQPKVILSSLGLNEQIKVLVRKYPRNNLTLTGCGSAYFAALCGVYLLSEISGKNAQAFVASDFDLLKRLDHNDVLIALSQSGETIDLLESLKQLKKKGVKIASAVNVLGSSLYRLAEDKILLGAGPEKAVCATKSFIAKLSFLMQLSFCYSGKEKEPAKALINAAEATDEVLHQKRKIKKLAKKISRQKNIFVLGRGIYSAIAFESALKIKEVSYIHAEGFAGGELKHGVIALVEKGTPCIVLAPNDQSYQSCLANAMELKARGGYVIGISPRKNPHFDAWLPVSDLGIATIFPMTVYGQLLAYYLALELKLDPDKPRNLAKSVTVK
ncbi:MAG: glutamine--fructose-6-phosphate transaminase (isomerizing) [Patescibacteria group bacterium]|nr:glutamine--fructose-6-phosphate transaminase (isomerizing) [Patescibacteria group bacterium]